MPVSTPSTVAPVTASIRRVAPRVYSVEVLARGQRFTGYLGSDPGSEPFRQLAAGAAWALRTPPADVEAAMAVAWAEL